VAATAAAAALGLKEQCETLPEMLISVPHFIIPGRAVAECESVCVCVCAGLALPHGSSPLSLRDAVQFCICVLWGRGESRYFLRPALYLLLQWGFLLLMPVLHINFQEGLEEAR
jgi:hypothetical protein